MSLYELWEYGYGNLSRFRYQARDEEKAIGKFMSRKVMGKRGYTTFKENLLEKGQDRILLCVKDPNKSGTKEHPNYPSIFHLKFQKENEEWKINQF